MTSHKILLKSTFVLLFVLLQACVSSKPPPDTFYYVLDPAPRYKLEKTSARQYQVLPVVLPNYMYQPNLVLKLSDHQIKITNYHYWADDLRKSVQRVLINELNHLNAELSFVDKCKSCVGSISISIDHYYPTESGDVLLAGTYVIENTLLPDQTTSHNFQFSTTLKDGGFDESVAKMRALLDQLSMSVNAKL